MCMNSHLSPPGGPILRTQKALLLTFIFLWASCFSLEERSTFQEALLLSTFSVSCGSGAHHSISRRGCLFPCFLKSFASILLGAWEVEGGRKKPLFFFFFNLVILQHCWGHIIWDRCSDKTGLKKDCISLSLIHPVPTCVVLPEANWESGLFYLIVTQQYRQGQFSMLVKWKRKCGEAAGWSGPLAGKWRALCPDREPCCHVRQAALAR